jgi:uncharacterized protein
MLFDFYAPLLKDRQKQFLEMYYRDDLTLSEIAELTEVSRQAVFDQLKRTEAVLEQFEDKLQLLSRYEHRKRLIMGMLSLVETNEALDPKSIRALVKDLATFELELD